MPLHQLCLILQKDLVAYSSKERTHFLDIANGSLMEVSSQIELAEAYHYISTTQREEFDSQILSIVKQLAGLRKALSQSSNPPHPLTPSKCVMISFN